MMSIMKFIAAIPGTIAIVEIVKAPQGFITDIDGRRWDMERGYNTLCNSWEEAHKILFDRAKFLLQMADKNLKKKQSSFDFVESMEKPKLN